jgi:predicted nucleic acid-binding protein
MLLAACRDAGVPRLYTEDFGSPSQIDGIEIINPFLVSP